MVSTEEGRYGEETGANVNPSSESDSARVPRVLDRAGKTGDHASALAWGTAGSGLPGDLMCRRMTWRPGNGGYLRWASEGRTKADLEERELTLAKATLGELMMRLKLAEVLLEKRGLMDEGKKPKR